MFALFALLSVTIRDGRREGQGEIETGDRKSSMLVNEMHCYKVGKDY